jgi:hypothetical protein
MTRRAATSTRSASDGIAVVRAVTVIMGVVVGLTFLFGFGNVLNLALRLGVPIWVAPLVAPAVDLSILGLLLGTRQLALKGASADLLRPARRLLIFASVVTLALNVADPIAAGEYGKAAFDAVGPLLLIGWAEVGPGFLRAIGEIGPSIDAEVGAEVEQAKMLVPDRPDEDSSTPRQVDQQKFGTREPGRQAPYKRPPEDLLDRARREDADHRVAHQRPISADTLRIHLGIGATQARRFVKIIRAEFQAQTSGDSASGDAEHDARDSAVTLVA